MMPIYDTTHIKRIKISNPENELYIFRHEIMDFADLHNKVREFDSKHENELTKEIIECFCTAKNREVGKNKISVDNSD